MRVLMVRCRCPLLPAVRGAGLQPIQAGGVTQVVTASTRRGTHLAPLGVPQLLRLLRLLRLLLHPVDLLLIVLHVILVLRVALMVL